MPVLQMVLKWWRKERKKIQVKKESQQNRSRWWIWSRDATWGILMCYLLLHQKAQGKPDMKVNFFWAHKLSSIRERDDPLYTLTYQTTQNGMLIKFGLLKSGNLINWWKIEQDDLGCIRTAHGQIHCWKRKDEFLHRSRISNVVNIQIILAQGEWSSAKEAKTILKRCNDKRSVIWCMFMSSTLQASVFMGKITQTIYIPSNIQKIAQWNRCSTNLRNWCLNRMRSMEWKQLNGKTFPGSICLWLVMNKSSVFSAQEYSVLCFGKIHENHQSNTAWEDRLTWFKSSSQHRTLD